MASPGADAESERVERAVLSRISPDPDQLERVRQVRERLVERANASARTLNVGLVRAVVAGSAARATFVKGRLDVDLFLLFPPETSRADLEREGLRLAEQILEKGEMRYAEHPYLRGRFEGFTVDAVPGYAVTDSARPLSAVDRTPFHQDYLERRETPALVEQVRLAKQFFLALGVYGADARTGGFSGYLTELLILRYERFRELLGAAQRWRLPVDLRSNPKAAPRVPNDVALVLDDPVDPNRNVASALTRRNLAFFALAAREYLQQPTERAFEVRAPPRLARNAALRLVAERGTHVSVLRFGRPELVDDILYPQLRKAEGALAEEAERLGFQILGSASAANGSAVIVLEFAHGTVPAVRVQTGPPPGIDRVGEFLGKWNRPDAPVFQGPYITVEGRLAVETRTERRGVEAALSARLVHLSLGRDLSGNLASGAALVPLEDADEDEPLTQALASLLAKRLPWVDGPRGDASSSRATD